MAYTIKIALDHGNGTVDVLRARLHEAADAAGFTINDVTRAHSAHARKPFAHGWVGLELRQVRRKERAAYCGQHAGPCVRPTRRGQRVNSVCLDGDDWMRFHGVVNDVLDAMGLVAEVYTTPPDIRGKMYVRKPDLGRRLRYDYKDDNVHGRFNMGLPHYVWNPGTPDQWTNGDGMTSEEE